MKVYWGVGRLQIELINLPLEEAQKLEHWPLGDGHVELYRELLELQRHEGAQAGMHLTDEEFENRWQQVEASLVDEYRERWKEEPPSELLPDTN